MTVNWGPLHTELAAWRAEQRVATFWWRDDDAVILSTQLDTLIDVGLKLDVPAHLAVIPKFAEPSLVKTCAATPLLVPLVHGWAHENHAPEAEKKAEFNHPRAHLTNDAARGLARINAMFDGAFLPCFVPPWNRISPELITELPGLGYTSVSTFTERAGRLAVPGLVQINTHIDPIRWRGGLKLVDADLLIDLAVSQLQNRRREQSDPNEPLGLLTHHLIQNPEVWAFSVEFMSTLLDGGASPLNLLELKDNLP